MAQTLPNPGDTALLDAGTNRVCTLHVPVSFRKCQSDWAGEYRKAADGITNDEQFLAESACPISAAGSGHRQRMQGWFWQIIIGIIVTVVGTVIANSIVRGPGGRHFMSGVHFSGPTRR